MHGLALFAVPVTLIALCATAQAQEFRVTFENRTGEEHKGVVLLAWDKSGQRHMDGVRPVKGNETVIFKFPNCSSFVDWQFLASVAYSDDPDNFDTVLVDTGRRKIEKCEYKVTGTKG